MAIFLLSTPFTGNNPFQCCSCSLVCCSCDRLACLWYSKSSVLDKLAAINLPVSRQRRIVRRIVSSRRLESRSCPWHFTSWSAVFQPVGIALQEFKEKWLKSVTLFINITGAPKLVEKYFSALPKILNKRLQKNLHDTFRIFCLQTFYRVN